MRIDMSRRLSLAGSRPAREAYLAAQMPAKESTNGQNLG